MACEMANHGLGELDVVGGAHGDGVLMGAGLEGELELVDERVIDDGGDAEKPADGRLGAELALGEHFLQFLLVGELSIIGAKLVAEFLEIDEVAGRESAKNKLAVGLDKNGLDDPFAGDVLLMSQVLGGISGVVLRPHEAHPHALEIGTKVQHGPPCWKVCRILLVIAVGCQQIEQEFIVRAAGSLM